MAVDAQMQRHKWLSMHRCGNPNGGRGTDAYKQQLIQLLMQSVDKLQQYIAKSV